MAVGPHKNLFGWVPWLGLPSSRTAYLLYNVTRDETNPGLGRLF